MRRTTGGVSLSVIRAVSAGSQPSNSRAARAVAPAEYGAEIERAGRDVGYVGEQRV